ncbi:hypothetical protein GCM10011571_16910 [Marinithermofilum abyssi]|uniref:Uncharacterized protein n=1 Tax=Marinithermofilum abyssi TaxID=1571185 RepID=A0A8J2VBX4_9BACL|nr:hypothetical protein GCM10011571_16910 [Marinithermofilum abyssi]
MHKWLEQLRSLTLKEHLFWITLITAFIYNVCYQYSKGYLEFFGAGLYAEPNLYDTVTVIIMVALTSLLPVILFGLLFGRSINMESYFFGCL